MKMSWCERGTKFQHPEEEKVEDVAAVGSWCEQTKAGSLNGDRRRKLKAKHEAGSRKSEID